MSYQAGKYVTGDGRIMNVQEIANIYRNCVNLATPSSGKIHRLDDHNYSLTCQFSTNDCDNLESIKTAKVYSLKTTLKSPKARCIESVRCVSDPEIVSTTVVTSNNGRFLARLKSATSGDKKQYLEIWDRSRLLKSLDISELEAHGDINTDSVFGSMSWYPFGEQDKLIYVCQKKRSKYQSFFKQTMPKSDTDKQDDGTASAKTKQLNLGDDQSREEDWGEQLQGISHMIIAQLDVGNNFKIVTRELDGHSLGDVKWLDGVKSISVAYPEQPRRLGLVHCNNRPSKLVLHDWSQSPPIFTLPIFTLESDTHSYTHPRVDDLGQRFVYLVSPTGGAHYHSSRLHLYDLNTKQDIELLDRSNDEKDMFINELSDNCFSADGKHILFVKHDHLYNHLCLLSLDELRLTKIKFPTTGLSLLDFRHDVILASGSEINASPTLFVAVLSPVANPGELVAWHQIEDCIHLDEIEYEPFTIQTADGAAFISAIFIWPSVELLKKNFSGECGDHLERIDSQQNVPTIVMLHGGPHSVFLVRYMPKIVFYARLGLRTLMVNYRGSSGVNEDYLKNLCGKVGKLDVEDCLHAIRHFVANKLIDPDKLIVYGGSHGGFLASHLACRKEFTFKSAILRNPVIDISTMHSTTDIPDWCYSEAFGHEKYDHGWVPTSAHLARMFECSPMSQCDDYKSPTLMLLGSLDRRVPMHQGERWVDLLKARGVKVSCKVYPDCHGLTKVSSSAEGDISSALWMLENL